MPALYCGKPWILSSSEDEDGEERAEDHIVTARLRYYSEIDCQSQLTQYWPPSVIHLTSHNMVP